MLINKRMKKLLIRLLTKLHTKIGAFLEKLKTVKKKPLKEFVNTETPLWLKRVLPNYGGSIERIKELMGLSDKPREHAIYLNKTLISGKKNYNSVKSILGKHISPSDINEKELLKHKQNGGYTTNDISKINKLESHFAEESLDQQRNSVNNLSVEIGDDGKIIRNRDIFKYRFANIKK